MFIRVSRVGAPTPSQCILCVFLVLQKAAREGADSPLLIYHSALGPQTFKSPLEP